MNTFDTDQRPTSGESLCKSCMWVHMQRGFRESEQTIFCNHAYPMRAMKFAVRECTDYSSRITPSRKDGNRFVPQDDESDSVCILE